MGFYSKGYGQEGMCHLEQFKSQEPRIKNQEPKIKNDKNRNKKSPDPFNFFNGSGDFFYFCII